MTETHTDGLLKPDQLRNLGAGLPRYYLHVVQLFEVNKAYSYAADFARLALKFAKANDDQVSHCIEP
jgi:hypothetical protein